MAENIQNPQTVVDVMANTRQQEMMLKHSGDTDGPRQDFGTNILQLL